MFAMAMSDWTKKIKIENPFSKSKTRKAKSRNPKIIHPLPPLGGHMKHRYSKDILINRVKNYIRGGIIDYNEIHGYWFKTQRELEEAAEEMRRQNAIERAEGAREIWFELYPNSPTLTAGNPWLIEEFCLTYLDKVLGGNI